MPVYSHTYRSYEGSVRLSFRWIIVMRQELRVLAKSRIFLLLVLLALLHFLFRLLQVVAYDVIMQDPNNTLTPFLRNIQALVVDAGAMFDFIRIQAPLVLITCLYAGSGMICNDFKNNLMEVYFSKPLTWLDYVLGKLGALIVLGLSITALPGVVLVVLHNLLLPGIATIQLSYWWPVSIVAFSLVVVVPCALGVLASSALFRGQNYAAIAVFMVLIANSGLGALLTQLVRSGKYLILSMPVAVNRIGEQCFGNPRPALQLSFLWSAILLSSVSLLCAWIVFRKVRRAEMAG